jgi:hypothetical protein
MPFVENGNFICVKPVDISATASTIPLLGCIGAWEGRSVGLANLADGAVFVCDEVSSIEFKDGLFYLTDVCGSIEIRRAMRPSTFMRCVAGATEIAREYDAWRRREGVVVPFHAAKPDKP